MEKLLRLPSLSVIQTYWILAKPGIIFGNAITATGGFLLASKGHVAVSPFLGMLFGLSLIIASGCVFNNYLDRETDKKMARTKHRPLVKGSLGTKEALVFGALLALLGTLFLALLTNLLTTALALFGLFMYVFVYSFVKYHSIHGTLIGSIAGAIPPVVGYCGAVNQLDGGALILFAMVSMWQMPHFLSIAIYRIDDYMAAAIPVLPLKRGVRATKLQITFYVIAFMIVSVGLTFFHYTGYVYLTIALLLGGGWLYLCLKGFRCEDDQTWARKVFFASLIVVTGLFTAIPFSIV